MPFPPLSQPATRAAFSSRAVLGSLRVAAIAVTLSAAAQAGSAQAFAAQAHSLDIAVVGDSLANDLGNGMEDLFRSKKNVNIIKQTRYSTGLTRKDYFNWNAKLRAFVGKNDVDTIVVLIGGNDSQSIRVKGRRLERFSEPWLAEYERRVATFMNILKRADAEVYWVGLPVVRSDSMSRRFRILNGIYRRQAVRHHITYVSIWNDFADSDGDYTSFGRSLRGVRRRLRKNDGMHFTGDGQLRLAARVARAIGIQ